MKWPDDFIKAVGVKPFHRSGSGLIYCSNCMDILPMIPDDAIDAVITDPPYGIGGASGTVGLSRSEKVSYDSFVDDRQYVQSICVPTIEGCIRLAPVVIVTPGSKCLTDYPQPDSFGSIIQPATVSLQKWGSADSQPIFYYGRDPRVGKTIQKCSYRLIEPPSCKKHPCSKPIGLMSWLVKRGTLDGQIVLDPFAGSGTTLVAAKQLGRKYIGIEISPEYCKIAEDRLRQEELF